MNIYMIAIFVCLYLQIITCIFIGIYYFTRFRVNIPIMIIGLFLSHLSVFLLSLVAFDNLRYHIPYVLEKYIWDVDLVYDILPIVYYLGIIMASFWTGLWFVTEFVKGKKQINKKNETNTFEKGDYK